MASGAKGRRFESFQARHPVTYFGKREIGKKEIMVAIAQLVEPWIVIPVVASSNLVSHPILYLQIIGSFGFQC
ncbi:hypothetical protein VCHA50P415_100129 [Vibrio chagasii]|nr:hypothetical protein VCHA34P131_120129 [Vibrio chagasii]CAH6810843.1 hypothetical protein VCHA34P121_120129 [Vibrio chagasii]CAH6892184.1 hypothetical protein VCHA50P415_100129 [Vibrio chagasii]CAH6895637.1 hypothetical protein VCHA40O231_110009 [Vibrio chagasii]CAH7098010.1 hypothetical protein VCHA57P526_100009 [Vibrio chagasii]